MSIDPRLMDLFAQWEERRQQGQPLTPEELCANDLDLLEEVRRRARQLLLFEPMSLATNASAEDTNPASVQDQTDSPLGTLVGRYRPTRFHAQGGLGQIYRAHDLERNCEVALKRIQPRQAIIAENRRRFLLEAEITSQLVHPGVVPVHGLVHDNQGQLWYAMRFVEGETLRDAIQCFHEADKKPRDPGERQQALRQMLKQLIAVCHTIAYAHSKGILHRDIKPSNIMLGKYGETLVVDWGLAKRMNGGPDEASTPASEDSPRNTDNELTQTGHVLGTPGYRSPEQDAAQWDQIGPASDIYSLGATLYALLTGRLRLLSGSENDTPLGVQYDRLPPPRQVKKEIPPALEAICLKAMARRPEQRYATALELASDLEHWLAVEAVE